MINGCHTTKNFRLQRRARQGGPISTYLFILVLKIIFISIKLDKNIDRINIFNYEYLYTAYLNDNFFKKKQTTVKNALNDIKSFSNFSGLHPNLNECKIVRIRVLKNVNVALCGIKNINLTKKV